mgnify:CR=1 FL=1|tara:strand:- start:48804 stop:49451 length:648 start_codon:yes stop_codon:yes gene_type:complete
MDSDKTMRTRIKICGICKPEYASQAEYLGVDAIGLVFVPESPRFVSIEVAAKIADTTGPFTENVGLFFNPTAEQVCEVLADVNIDILQFHGNEKAVFCESFGLPYLKAVRVQSGQDVLSVESNHENASALLLDSYSSKAMGGTGETFDWSLVPKISKPLILAGGLTPDNVAESIQALVPYGVDVSSGVESSPAVKDTDRMRAFVSRVNSAQNSNG